MDAFYFLALLACPVGMGAMMWFMMKGSRSSGAPAQQRKTTDYAGFGSTDPRQTELASLRKEVADLRSQVQDQGQNNTPHQKETR